MATSCVALAKAQSGMSLETQTGFARKVPDAQTGRGLGFRIAGFPWTDLSEAGEPAHLQDRWWCSAPTASCSGSPPGSCISSSPCPSHSKGPGPQCSRCKHTPKGQQRRSLSHTTRDANLGKSGPNELTWGLVMRNQVLAGTLENNVCIHL